MGQPEHEEWVQRERAGGEAGLLPGHRGQVPPLRQEGLQLQLLVRELRGGLERASKVSLHRRDQGHISSHIRIKVTSLWLLSSLCYRSQNLFKTELF